MDNTLAIHKNRGGKYGQNTILGALNLKTTIQAPATTNNIGRHTAAPFDM
jgi:hypothetical protein